MIRDAECSTGLRGRSVRSARAYEATVYAEDARDPSSTPTSSRSFTTDRVRRSWIMRRRSSGVRVPRWVKRCTAVASFQPTANSEDPHHSACERELSETSETDARGRTRVVPAQRLDADRARRVQPQGWNDRLSRRSLGASGPGPPISCCCWLRRWRWWSRRRACNPALDRPWCSPWSRAWPLRC